MKDSKRGPSTTAVTGANLARVHRCMLLTSHPGDVVFDPFLGSGTVGVVAIEADHESRDQTVSVARNDLGQDRWVVLQSSTKAN